jgi:hypothetical protein
MKPQEIFDKVVRHLFKQNKKCTCPSVVAGVPGSCLYRGENNTSCAIGSLIPDHLYDVSFENRGIRSLMLKEEISDYFGIENEIFLSSLQGIHDDADINFAGNFNRGSLHYALKNTADTFNLSTEVLEEVYNS